MLPVKFLVPHVEFTHRQGQDDLELEKDQILANAVPRSVFERSPGALDGIERVIRADEPSFRNEVVRSGPIFGFPLDGVVQDPHHRLAGWIGVAGIVHDADSVHAFAHARGRREETHGLFDDDVGVG